MTTFRAFLPERISVSKCRSVQWVSERGRPVGASRIEDTTIGSFFARSVSCIQGKWLENWTDHDLGTDER
jgi:hypothetical protein